MADWKTTNFVPDSDGEDDSLSTQSVEGTPPRDGLSENGFVDIAEFEHRGSVDVDPRCTKYARGKSLDVKETTVDNIINELQNPLPSIDAENSEDELSLPAPRPRPNTNKTCRISLDALFSDSSDTREKEQSTSGGQAAAQLAEESRQQLEKSAGSDSQNRHTICRSPGKSASDVPSVPSSPLSEPASTPSLGSSPHFPENTEINRPTPPAIQNAPEEITQSPQNNQHAWKFRKRRTVQLMPYTVEGAHHRQTFHAGGLKPIRYREEVPDIHRQRRRQHDTQDQEYGLDNTQSTGNGSDCETRRPTLPKPPLFPSSPPGVDEQLLDMASLLTFPDLGEVCKGAKRRKTAHVYSIKGELKEKRTPQTEAERLPRLASTEGSLSSVQDNVFIVPPSPPSSSPRPRTKPIVVIENGFKYPPQLTPQPQLRTPDLTSEVKEPERVIIDEDQPGSSNNAQSQFDHSESNDESESAPERDREIEMLQAKRKIRGVLPASWLRIDQKKQIQNPAPMRNHTSRESHSPIKTNQRSIARQVSRHKAVRSLSVRHDNLFVLPDDSESDNDILPSGLPNQEVIQLSTPCADSFGPLSLLDDSESMEDNDIDRMLPPNRNRKRQSQTMRPSHKDTDKARPASTIKERGLYRPRQSKISAHVIREKVPKQKRQKKKVTRLSIVDVADADTINAAPDFVRIAARTAKIRNDEGRHSPTRKVLQLATREDTADVQETLNFWKRNAIVPLLNSISRERRARSNRLPLSDTSGNQRKISRQAPKTTIAQTLGGHSRSRSNIQSTIQQILKQTKTPQGRLPTTKQSSTSRVWPQDHRPGVLHSTIRNSNRTMPALLEVPQHLARAQHNAHPARDDSPVAPGFRERLVKQNPVLQRFLEPSSPNPEDESIVGLRASTGPLGTIQKGRKRLPRQITLISVAMGQDVTSYGGGPDSTTLIEQDALPSFDDTSLSGFSPYGSEYTSTFDVKPLPTGPCFGPKTVLGSGLLARCLASATSRDMQEPKQELVLQYRGNRLTWGAWTEGVHSEMATVVGGLVSRLGKCSVEFSDLPSEVVSVLCSTIQYFAEHLYFLDAIDRGSFIVRCSSLVQGLVHALEDAITCLKTGGKHDDRSKALAIRLRVYATILSFQLAQIAKHRTIGSDSREITYSQFSTGANRTIETVFEDGITDLFRFQRDLSDYATYNLSSELCQLKAEAFVIILHICGQQDMLSSVWNGLETTQPFTMLTRSRNIQSLDRKWFNLFVLLPFSDISTRGVVETSSRHVTTSDNWPLVQRLMDPIVHAYQTGLTRQSLTFNEYFRGILGRCLCLIQTWGWHRCDPIIRHIYDFFATNNLGDLHHEESRGHPRFLGRLDENPVLELEREDRSFHIFLKILSVGLQRMQAVYSGKTIRGVAFRVTPNHSRSLPKDEVVRQEDLDALRNHHSLLTVLYYASPVGFRPRVETIRSLVRVEDSHRAACHISIRAWSDLVGFQLSQNEPVSALSDFMDWYSELLGKVIQQHKLARTEVESHSTSISKEQREMIISGNQRHIEAILLDSLECLRKAIENSRSVDAARSLLAPTLKDIFALFGSKGPRIDDVVIEGLKVIEIFIKKIEAMHISDDSQDFGEWPSFDSLEPSTTAESKIPQPIYHALHTLLSDCFGAEAPPDDKLIKKVVESWISVAHLEVKESSKSWADYVGNYGKDSWSVLRQTEQTSKFTPFFHTLLIEQAPEVYEEHGLLIFKSWITSLVARESQLKFQSQLTTAILNCDTENPLLNNLPFTRHVNGKFEVSDSEFSSRRLSLISCLLSNMRQTFDFTIYQDLSEKAARRRDYVDILRTMMTSIKENYESLGTGPNKQGAYVELVQIIVGLLQQYTADILPVHRFFTDARTFPLPDKDPTYVVGRLKSYGVRLHDPRTAKQLATFIYSVLERAIVDGKQQYLISQLETALSNSFENGDPEKPTLRAFFIHAIVPAYSRTALGSPCGWIIAMPVFYSLQGTFTSILYDMDGANSCSVAAVFKIIVSLLYSIQQSVKLLVDHPGHLEQENVVRVLTVYFSVVTATLRPLDYCIRLEAETGIGFSLVMYLKDFANFALATMMGRYDTEAPLGNDIEQEYVDPGGTKTVREYAQNELEISLATSWVSDGKSYEGPLNGTRKRIQVDLEDYEGEKARFQMQYRLFLDELNVMPAFSEE